MRRTGDGTHVKTQHKSWDSFRRRARGYSVLAGWATGIAPLTSIVTGLAATHANAAVGFLLCGLSLMLRAAGGRSAVRTSVARGLAAIALVLAILAAREVGTALCLGVSALALITLPRRASDWCSIAVGAMSLVALTGYLYSIATYHHLISYGSFPLPSALTFLLLSSGTLLADPDRGLVRDLYQRGPSGTVLRKLIPAALIIPALLAWLVLEGERVSLFQGQSAPA